MPTSAERAIRRRIRSRSEAGAGPGLASRARPSRRLRRLLARSRSAGTSRECSYRHAYERSHSCPEYPVHVNTYKITENKKDYVFQIALPLKHTHVFPNSIGSREQKRVAPVTVLHYGNTLPVKTQFYQHRSKLQSRQESATPWYSTRPLSLDYSYYEEQKNKETRRRKLPNIEHLQNVRIRSLPNIPSVNIDNTQGANSIAISGNNIEHLIQSDEIPSQYHGYDSDGSEAETTIHVSIDKQNSMDSGKCELQEVTVTDCHTSKSLIASNKRKKFLSLDLKSSYEPVYCTQSQSLDIPEPYNDNIFKRIIKSENDSNKTIKNNTVQNKTDNTAIRRRHSDSLVLLKCTPESRATPEEMKGLFKKMSISSTKPIDLVDLSTKKDEIEKGTRKHTNVSINENPTFQEYYSPSSLFPQSSLDLPVLKPLPSIIKKARTRSHSLASSDHLVHELSMMANTMFIALSPPNLGSPRRALTPVASHLPLDDIHHDIHTTATESLTSEKLTTGTETQTAQPMAQRKCNRSNSDRNKNRPGATKKQRGKPEQRRESKRSNDYGGRENGRGNNQPQALERRESRRGQFTRSLSNADVPPDEKAGKYKILLYKYIRYN